MRPLSILVVAGGLAVSATFLFAVFPRGRIADPVVTPPSDWSFLGSDSTCQLEVRPSSPRSVRVGCYPHRGSLYVHSHRWALAPRLLGESWAQAVVREPAVRLGHAGRAYELEVTLVSDAELRNEILSDHRGFDPVPRGILLFRLHPRE